MNNMIIGCGPYIGNFEQEIITFMPYSKWLSNAVDFDKIYLNTHMDRMWLYDFIPEENKIPVDFDLSIDVECQKGYINTKLSQKKFQKLIKKFKNEIIERSGYNKKDVKIYNLSYIKTCVPYSIYNKIFSPLKEEKISYIDKILYIPYIGEDEDLLYVINDELKKYGHIIIGSYDIYLKEWNSLLLLNDGFHNTWKHMINYISSAKAVVCPLSFWTTICNLQGTPVFSWGDNIGQHKENGIYHFNNYKSMVIPYKGMKNKDIIINMMEYFIRNYI